jgi:ribulose 1,5-bisphosphate carboxylase large subunit-like protein
MDKIGDSITATYYIETDKDLASVAKRLADLETTGGYPEGKCVSDLFRRCTGEVSKVEEKEKGKGFIHLLYPLCNLNMREAAFSSLWLYLIGGATHALVDYHKSRLVDFHLPEEALRYFPGPGFGISGIRKILKTEPGELLLGTIVKPTAGLTPEEVADICRQMALGGVRFIKDDEKMMNSDYCRLAKRVRLVTKALEKVRKTTGKTVLYAPHITAGPEQLTKNARIAVKNGANALMLNIFAAGFHALETLRRDSKIDVPLYAHCGGKEAFSRAQGQGVSPEVVARLSRMMGADFFRVSILGGHLVGGSPDELLSLKNILTSPLGDIKDTVPALSGGLKPGNLRANLDCFGQDCFYLVGTGVTQYPGGIAAGFEAMKREAEAFTQGR